MLFLVDLGNTAVMISNNKLSAEAIAEYPESTPAAEFMPIKKIYELGADGSKVCCLKEKYHLSISQKKNNDKDGYVSLKCVSMTS